MLALAGCAAVPHLPPAPSLADHPATTTATSLAGGTASFPTDQWWQGFGDPQLTELITEGLQGAPDVKLAAARVRAAEAMADESRAATLPTITADGTVGIVQQSKNLGIPPQFVPPGIQDTGRITLSGNFDLDLWGRNRARLRAARSEAEAARVDQAQAALMLSTAIATAYADLARLYAERDVAATAVQVRGQTATLTGQRVRAGLGTEGDVAAARARAAGASADVQALDEQLVLTRNRLAALTGAGPDRGLHVTRPTLRSQPSALPANLPLDLLGRRPDIVSARLRAEAGAARIKAAKASFYPNINLAGLIGLQALGLENLFSSNSLYLNAGPAISLPIFEGGRLRAQYRGARATYDGDVAQYEGNIVTALREVADAAGSLRALQGQLAQQRAALAAAQDAKRVAELRYRAGLTNQLAVLLTDDQLLLSRRAVADLEARTLTLQVSLIRALGGGFASAPSTMTGVH
ncbi:MULTISPECIES: efflux transporter outer membrane subunit [Sphingomonas]|uniref:efflux transporter outer membrane subunit n=1 Tax=Sphingomonas TaxID=13687 RepID=UPI001F08127F|nr:MULTISPECIES: efflux transporter outer membrane subunit [Sphingomonas]